VELKQSLFISDSPYSRHENRSGDRFARKTRRKPQFAIAWRSATAEAISKSQNLAIAASDYGRAAIKIEPRHASRYLFITRNPIMSNRDRKWNSDDFSLRRFVLYVYDTWARFCRIFVVRLIILINHRSLNHVLINQSVFLKIQIVYIGIKIRSTRNRRKRTHKLVFILILHLILIVHDFN